MTDMTLAEVEASAIRKMRWRLMPILMMSYFSCYMIRTNISFAALTMNADLGISKAMFGLASGIFFLGYMLFEVPSNLALHRFGPRKWLARIMLTWAIFSMLTALAWNAQSLIVIRFLLGVAEAGFMPGVILYLSQAFPDAYRGRITGTFLMMVPVSSIMSAPLSTWLLTLDGLAGLKGWQILFLVEAMPSVILAVVLFFYLRDKPVESDWLTPTEQSVLSRRLANENRAKVEHKLLEALTDKRVLALGLVNFGVLITHQTVGLWLPQIIHEFGWEKSQIGWSMGGLYVLCAAAMAYWGRHSDRKRERKYHLLGALSFACIALVVSAVVQAPLLKFMTLTVALVCSFASMSVILAIPTQFLKDRAAAGGVAMIVSIGSFSGFLGSAMVGKLRELSGSFTLPILVIAGLGGVACFVLSRLDIGRPSAAPVDSINATSMPPLNIASR